jgi:twitching motility protein PilJ
MDGTQNPNATPRAARAPKQRISNDTSVNSGGLLGGLKVWQKLAIIVFVAVIPIAVLIYLFFTAQAKQIDSTFKEQRGVNYLNVTRDFLEFVPAHRGLTSRLLNGDKTVAQDLEKASLRIDGALKNLAEIDAKHGAEFGTTELVNKFRTEWIALEKNLESPAPMSAAASFAEHSRLMKEYILTLISLVGTRSDLILDPEKSTYYAVDLAATILPEFVEVLGQMRGAGASALTTKRVTQEERINLGALVIRRKQLDDTMIRSINFAAEGHPEIGKLLHDLDDKGGVFAEQLSALARAEIINAKALTYAPKAYFDAGTQAIAYHLQLQDASLQTLTRLLGERVVTLRSTQLISALVALGSLLLLGLIAFFFVRSITNPVSNLVRVVQKFGGGDLSELATVQSRDEIGILAGSFNQSIMRLRGLVSTEAERDDERRRRVELQNNIGEFLNVTMDISQGNLTRKGKVSEDVLGNVVDAINVMTEEIGYLLKDVERVAQQVNSGSNDVSNTNNAILQGAQSQSQIAQKARAQALEVTNSIRAMAQKALETAQASQQTLQASQAGQAALQETLSGMQNIRREVQGISKSIKSLSDRSLEISEITETISGIASQTNMLALNAAIEASGAGEAGARFAIVADEVRKLAEDSARATGRVTNLIKNIQNEIQSVVIGVEGGTREVEQGYKIATQAGERLKEISVLANQSAVLVQTISSATRAQAGGVEQVKNAVEAIAQSAGQAEAQSNQGRESAAELQKLSLELTSSLSRFQLPS